MARYSPTAEVKIAKPCGESWQAMRGDSRVRHCDACGRDVINAASLTPEQIEEHIRAGLKGKPMPCMRLVQFEDGTLLTARTERGLSLIQRVAAGVSALAVMATSAVAQQPSTVKDATVTGRVVDVSGAGIQGASVQLQQPHHADIRVETAADGTFKIEAVSGEYALFADRSGFQDLAAQQVILHKGDQVLAPLKLEISASMGSVVIVEPNTNTMKTESPKMEGILAPATSPQYATPARR